MDTDDKYTRITLRIPKDLHSRLSGVAEDSSKSLNAEIVGRLQQSFEPEYQPSEIEEAFKMMSKDLIRQLRKEAKAEYEAEKENKNK